MQTIESPTAAPVDRLPVLEAARGVAMLLVFAFHGLGRAYGRDHLTWNGMWRDPSSAPTTSFWFLYPLTFAWVGVPLFFVLSGFVIHRGTLVTSKPFDARHFVWRRAWRIYPPYLLALGVFFAFAKDASPTQLLSHALLFHNFSNSGFYGINPSLWSIATEFQFYLAYPLVVWARGRWGIARVFWISVAVAVASLVVAVLFDHSYEAPKYWLSTPVLWWTWMLGAYMAERHFQGRPWHIPRAPVGMALVLAFLLAHAFKPTHITVCFWIGAVLSAIVLEIALRRPHAVRPSHLSRWVAFVGLVSYSLYLWHQPVLHLAFDRVAPTLGGDSAVRLALVSAPTLLVLIAFSYALFRFVEKPSAAVGRHARRRSRPAHAANSVSLLKDSVV